MARRRKAHVSGADLVAQNITTFTKGFLNQVNVDIEKVRALMSVKMKENSSHTDHTLQDLARMGYPYATRAPQNIHQPEYVVHKQGGELFNAEFSKVEKASVSGGRLRAVAYIGVDESKADHAPHVIYGTWKMVPRDFLTGSAMEVADEARDTLRRSLKNAVVTFQGVKTRL